MSRLSVKKLCIVFLLLLPVTASAIDLDPIHDPGNGYTCLNCHTAHVTLGTTGYNNICLDCHKPGVPQGGSKPFVAIDAADPFHIYTAQLPGNRVQNSHRWDGIDTVPAAGAQPPLLEPMTRLDLRGRTKGLLACVSCHSPHSNSSKPFLRMVNDSDQICLDCHRSRNKSSHTAGTHPVNVNYSSAKPKYSTPINANPANPTSAMKLNNGVVLCTTCHSVHYADSNSATFDSYSSYNSLTPSNGYLLRTDLHGANGNSINICTNCHAGKKNHTYRNQNIQCSDCHAAHVDFDPQDPLSALGNNSFLVRRYINVSTPTGSIRNRRVFLLQTSASARIYKTVDNTGICQACHAVPTGGSYPAAHRRLTATASDCTLCHYHNNTTGAFSASSSCNACHGYPPTSAIVGGPSGVASPATSATIPPNPGAHAVHVTTRSMGCETCHNGYTDKPMPSKTIDMGFAVNGDNFTGFAGSVTTGTLNVTDTLTTGYSWDPSASAGTTINTPGVVAPTCTNIYCHGSTLTGGVNSSPSWVAGPSQAACGTCHGATAAAPPTTGNHARHAGNAPTALALTCNTCHGSVIGNAHVNGRVTWDLAGIGVTARYKTPAGAYAAAGTTGNLAPSAAYGTCSDIYCHSNVQGASGSGSPTLYGTPSWGGAALACGSCHLDMAISPAATGSHLRHVQSAGYLCATCHNNAGHDTIKHADANIDVLFAPPNAGGSYNQNPNTPGNGYGSCTNIYCHGAGSPVWGGTLPAGCTGCHGNSAASGTPMTSGKHPAHIGNYSTLGRNNGFACVTCHANTISDSTTISNPLNHVNSLKNYSGLRAGRIALPGTGGCAVVYCHSTGERSNRFQDISLAASNWYSAKRLNCNGCHGSRAFGGYSTVTGEPNYANAGAGTAAANSHLKHVPDAGIANTTGCAKCHAKTVDSGIPSKLRDYSSAHLDGSRNVSFSAAIQGRYSATTQQCLSTYCHGTAATPAWGSSALTCNQCHEASSALAGSHATHWNSVTPATNYGAAPGNRDTTGAVYQFECSSCHGTPATHSNGTADQASGAAAQVYFGYTSPGRKGIYSYGAGSTPDARGFRFSGSGSCSSTYCHSDGNGNNANNTSFTWTSGTLDCTGCHGGDAASAAPIASGRHTAHMNNAAVIGVNFGCIECHAKTVSSNSTLSNRYNHVNRLKDYSGARAGGSSNYSAGMGQCSNIYCHSNGKGVYVDPPAWTSGATLSCNGCHGSSGAPEFNAATTGAPNYASGGAGSAAANSHKRHVFLAGITDTTGCAKCHEKVVDPATPGKFKNYTAASYHLNGKNDLNFKTINGKTGSFNGSSCSATYCHGTAASPQWGLTVGLPLPCNSCHSAKADSGYWNANSAHGIHWEGNTLPTSYNALPGNSLGDASTYRFACSSCHYPGTTYAAHAAGPANLSGAAQLFFGYTTSTIKGSYTYGTTQGTADNGFNWTNGTGCTSTYCHSNGNGDPGATGIDWASNSSSIDLNIRCNSCHMYTDASGSPMDTGSHGRHVSNNGISCSTCHYGTTSNGSTITDKRMHVNKTKDVSWDPVIGGAIPYSTPNCIDIYCHSKGTTFSAPYTGAGISPNTPPAWGTGLDCNGCHDYSDIDGDTGPSYPNGSPKANSHLKHVRTMGYGCGECHNGNSHVDKVYDLAPGSYPFSVVGGTGNPTAPAQCTNSYCHSKGTVFSAPYTGAGISPNTPPAWGTGVGCSGCHDGLGTGPSYANGAPKANSHYFHVVVQGYTCEKCHNSTTSDGTTITTPANHANNIYDVQAGVGVTFDSTPGDATTPTTCDNISCHHHNGSTWGAPTCSWFCH